MKKLVAVLLALVGVVGLVLATSSNAGVRWEGRTDLDMLHQVQKDLDQAVKDNVSVLKVSLSSPGGPVITMLEIAKIIRDTEEKTGLIVEIHASMICASGCTFVLASGTPNYRYINNDILFLVHSMQNDSGCIDSPTSKDSQEEKANARLLEMMRNAYKRFTGRSYEEVTEWTTCGKEIVGGGSDAVRMHIADHVE